MSDVLTQKMEALMKKMCTLLDEAREALIEVLDAYKQLAEGSVFINSEKIMLTLGNALYHLNRVDSEINIVHSMISEVQAMIKKLVENEVGENE